MNNFPAIFRSLIIYSVCVVLAVWLGFMLASPLTYSQLFTYGLLAFILLFPILLRWHYPLLLLSWSMAAVVPFLPGRPSLYLLMVAISLGISVLQRLISKDSRFISAPQITLPLFFMLAVALVTAKLTGFGLHALGGGTYGGKKYFYLVGGILGYFALTARKIPLERKNLYLGLFFLGGVVAFVEDLLPILPHSLWFIYNFFDFSFYAFNTGGGAHLPGARIVGQVVLMYMLARYGIRGIFLSRRPLRWLTFALFAGYGALGGFRGFIVMIAMVMAIQFFMEGLHRTKWLPISLLAGTLGAVALFPLAPYLPDTMQRALTIVPLPYNLSAQARMNAQATLQWRLDMWDALLPEIPKYLLLGKGYTINPLDYEFVMGPEAAIHNAFAQNDPMALAQDYHSGPLSVVLPFGIWGCLAFLWFLIAGLRVLYLNFRYGDSALRTANAFFFAAFVSQTIYFLVAFGDLSSGMVKFTGLLGLSVAFNGGVRRRVLAAKPARPTRPVESFRRLPPAPAPAFQHPRRGTAR